MLIGPTRWWAPVAATFVAATALVSASASTTEPAAHRASDDSQVLLSSLDASQRRAMQTEPGQTRVFLEGDVAGLGMQAGRVSLDGDSLRVEFPFPLARDANYELKHPALDEALVLRGEARDPSPPSVARVYPATDELPANVLRLYVEFDEPMSAKFNMSQSVEIVDLEDGKVVDSALLDMEQPLFDRSHERLTVIFNPGRTKRGVGSNLEGGAPLQPNRRYALRVRAGLNDAQGDELPVHFEHAFSTLEAERSSIVPSDWKVDSPEVATRAPLHVEFGRWLDPFQARSRISVLNPLGSRFPLQSRSSGDQLWLTPQEDWQPGCYELVVSPELEDVSGNRTTRAFDDEGKGTRKVARRAVAIGDMDACRAEMDGEVR